MILTESNSDRIKVLLEEFVARTRYSIEDEQEAHLSYAINPHSVTILENRSDPHTAEGIKVFPIANVRYFDTFDCWHVVFLNEDVEWHAYEPEQDLEAESLSEALEFINKKLSQRFI